MMKVILGCIISVLCVPLYGNVVTKNPMAAVLQIDKQLLQLEQSRLRYEKKIAELNKIIEESKIEISKTKAQLTKTLSVLQQRLLMYKQQSPQIRSKIIFDSQDLKSALRKAQILRLVVEHDKDMLTQYELEQQRLVNLQEQAYYKQKELFSVESSITVEQQKIEKLRLEKLKMAKAIMKQKELVKQIGIEYAKASEGLAKMLMKQAQEMVVQPGAFDKFQGRLPWPVKGDVVRNYGKEMDPSLHLYTRYKGIDIKAPQGSPVMAVHAGEIVYQGWLEAYGQLLIVDHGAGFHTIYGHLARSVLQLGDSVEIGQIIGYLGDTGSIYGASLYFEIRHGGQTLDPTAWLN